MKNQANEYNHKLLQAIITKNLNQVTKLLNIHNSLIEEKLFPLLQNDYKCKVIIKLQNGQELNCILDYFTAALCSGNMDIYDKFKNIKTDRDIFKEVLDFPNFYSYKEKICINPTYKEYTYVNEISPNKPIRRHFNEPIVQLLKNDDLSSLLPKKLLIPLLPELHAAIYSGNTQLIETIFKNSISLDSWLLIISTQNKNFIAYTPIDIILSQKIIDLNLLEMILSLVNKHWIYPTHLKNYILEAPEPLNVEVIKCLLNYIRPTLDDMKSFFARNESTEIGKEAITNCLHAIFTQYPDFLTKTTFDELLLGLTSEQKCSTNLLVDAGLPYTQTTFETLFHHPDSSLHQHLLIHGIYKTPETDKTITELYEVYEDIDVCKFLLTNPSNEKPDLLKVEKQSVLNVSAVTAFNILEQVFYNFSTLNFTANIETHLTLCTALTNNKDFVCRYIENKFKLSAKFFQTMSVLTKEDNINQGVNNKNEPLSNKNNNTPQELCKKGLLKFYALVKLAVLLKKLLPREDRSQLSDRCTIHLLSFINLLENLPSISEINLTKINPYLASIMKESTLKINSEQYTNLSTPLGFYTVYKDCKKYKKDAISFFYEQNKQPVANNLPLDLALEKKDTGSHLN